MSVGLQNEKEVETKNMLRQRSQIKKCLGLDKIGNPLAVRSVVGLIPSRNGMFCVCLGMLTYFLVYYSSRIFAGMHH